MADGVRRRRAAYLVSIVLGVLALGAIFAAGLYEQRAGSRRTVAAERPDGLSQYQTMERRRARMAEAAVAATIN